MRYYLLVLVYKLWPWAWYRFFEIEEQTAIDDGMEYPMPTGFEEPSPQALLQEMEGL